MFCWRLRRIALQLPVSPARLELLGVNEVAQPRPEVFNFFSGVGQFVHTQVYCAADGVADVVRI
jgi:hypothetical protein